MKPKIAEAIQKELLKIPAEYAKFLKMKKGELFVVERTFGESGRQIIITPIKDYTKITRDD